MKNTFILKFVIAIFISISVVSCMKDDKEQPIGCEPAPVLSIPFNVLDASTGQDLFFSASPRYQTSSLYFFRKKDQARKDTIRPMIWGTGANRVFGVQVTNAITQDTLLMKIAANPDDVIIYNTKNGTGECPYLIFDKVLLNGTLLTANQGKFNFLK